MHLDPDADVERLDNDRILLGGSPLTMLRLTDEGAAVWRRLADDAAAPVTVAERVLADRLVSAGVLHPVLDPTDRIDVSAMTVVIPVRDRPAGLDRALRALRSPGDPEGAVRVIVVDDGSVDATRHRRVAADHGAEVLRLERSGGPARARNRGAAAVLTPVVAFVDSDMEVSLRELLRLAAHLSVGSCALAAPRIGQAPGRGAVDRYERAAGSLDLGPRPGAVAPRARVSYVPSAVMVCDAKVLSELGGFDESMTVAEDVDLCWRMVQAGHSCRYDPDVEAIHHGRTDAVQWALRRVQYGTGAAALDRRHPGSVPPVSVSAWSVVVWAAASTGRPLISFGVLAGTTELLARKLAAVPKARRVAWRLAGRGHLGAGSLLARAVLRPYLPVAVLAAWRSRRCRAVVAAAVITRIVSSVRDRPSDLDPARWIVLLVVDDVAYSAGVWLGAVRERRIGPLVADLSSWSPRSGSRRL